MTTDKLKAETSQILSVSLRVLPLLVVLTPMLLWAAEQHFTTNQALQEMQDNQRIRAIDDQLFEIEYRMNKNRATEFDYMNKSRLERERKQLREGVRHE